MTNTEREFLQKVCDENTVAFKTKDTDWVIIDCSKPFDKERREKLRDKGIGVCKDGNNKIFYLLSDYGVVTDSNLEQLNFVAKKDVVYSVPVVLRSFDKYEHCVQADTVDLTDFCGVIQTRNYELNSVIVGDNVRVLDEYNYKDTLLGIRGYTWMFAYSSTKSIKIVGDTPITNMHFFCCNNRGLQSLDLSEANLKECGKFNSICFETRSLSSVKMGDINMDAECKYAFHYSKFNIDDMCFTIAKDMKEFVNNKNMKSKVFGG